MGVEFARIRFVCKSVRVASRHHMLIVDSALDSISYPSIITALRLLSNHIPVTVRAGGSEKWRYSIYSFQNLLLHGNVSICGTISSDRFNEGRCYPLRLVKVKNGTQYVQGTNHETCFRNPTYRLRSF